MSEATEHKMTAQELRGHSDDELRSMTKSLGEELFKFRMQRHTNQLENTMQIRKVRRDIARVHTILTARRHGLETRLDPAEVAAAVEAKQAAPVQAKAKSAATPKPKKATKSAKPTKAKAAAKKAKPKAKTKKAKR